MSGKVGIFTSKRFWISSNINLSSSEEMKEIARPLVPKRPARPTYIYTKSTR
jgi:hypothetical protein